MRYDNEAVGAFFELEGGCSEIGFGRGLVDLFRFGALCIVDGEIQAGAGISRGRTGYFREGSLLDAEDGDGEVAIRVVSG